MIGAGTHRQSQKWRWSREFLFATLIVFSLSGKILCHNLVVLIHETKELGIDPVFIGLAPQTISDPCHHSG